ncbi:Bcr/CflA family efflux MFS transporter [Rhodobacterales bacterium HKCCE2091]|nr:Bcr/CflA family efflux MFS transporter [Rhodobacterales bacterium HKCCE2091]
MTARPAVRFLDRTTPPHIFTLIAIVGIGALSMNVFLPSLPAMADYFAAEYRTVQLSVAVYLGVNAVLQIILGPVSDRFGRRPVLLFSITLFLLATIGCILARSIEVFLVFRMLQAVIASGLVLSRAVVRDMVPAEEAASMIAYVTMGMALVPMIGPVIGGLLGDFFGWHASFWLLLALGAAVLWLTWRDLGETATDHPSSFREQFREYPELLLSPRFWGYALTAAFSAGAFFAYLGGAPYVGSEVYGLTPGLLGILFGAPALGYFFGNYVSGRYSVRFGINAMVIWGSGIATAGLVAALAMFLAGIDGPAVFFGFMTFVGFGNGMVLPNATSGMLSVRPHLAGTASGLGGAIMIAGGAALSALAGFLLEHGTGAFPLLYVMVVTSACGVVAILLTVRREARLLQRAAE